MPSSRRVMWLLNHTTARQFELPMLRKLGYLEIFLPKFFPQDINFRSGSVDWSQDDLLTIPKDDLAILNQTDWYSEIKRDVWAVVNKHFDLLFLMSTASIWPSLTRHFRGAAIVRAYGLAETSSYTRVFYDWAFGGLRGVEDMGRRFWLGSAYRHLMAREDPWLQSRDVYLPIGMHDCHLRDDWAGSNPTLLFVCPDLEGIDYYQAVYREFKTHFGDLPYAIGGAQALSTTEKNALGFVPMDQFDRNMREYRVMYYHSREPYHLHYHPLEAIRAGMPLVFMAGGMLDKLGGSHLPGRCETHDEARTKLKDILSGERKIIEAVRRSQSVILNEMCPDSLEPFWKKGLALIEDELDRSRAILPPFRRRRRRIGIIDPIPTTFFTLRSLKQLAEAISIGSECVGEHVDVVVASTDHRDSTFRPISWKLLDREAARRAMLYGGHRHWKPASKGYFVPDDGMENLCDCDLWILVSDKFPYPLLPIRPYLLMIHDYGQRYDDERMARGDDNAIAAARAAQRVLVSTRFAEQDAVSYAGVAGDKVLRVPLIIPRLEVFEEAFEKEAKPFFLWITDSDQGAYRDNCILALRHYYGRYCGKFNCIVAAATALPATFVASLKSLECIHILENVTEKLYLDTLSRTQFLWQPDQINGCTLAAVEAAGYGVPSLLGKSPALEEFDEKFRLQVRWIMSKHPEDMARQLKSMEDSLAGACPVLPRPDEQDFACTAEAYWKVVREYL